MKGAPRRQLFYDWEFIEDGETIIPVSLGMVGFLPSDPELYLINADAERHYHRASPWVKKNVLDRLDSAPGLRLTLPMLREALLEYCGCTPADRSGALAANGLPYRPAWGDLYPPAEYKLRLWTWYGAYDHVALAQLFGPMVSLPRGLPMYSMDLKVVTELYPWLILPAKPQNAHNALADARWLRGAHQTCACLLTQRGIYADL